VLSAVARSGLPFACVLDAVGVPAAPEHAPVFTTAVHLLDAEPAASNEALQAAGLSLAPLEARFAPHAEQQSKHPVHARAPAGNVAQALPGCATLCLQCIH